MSADIIDALEGLRERMAGAESRLHAAAEDACTRREHDRITGKIQGFALARTYVLAALTLLRPAEGEVQP